MTDDGAPERSTTFDADRLRDRMSAVLFGDRVGLAIFLATVALFVLYWNPVVRINDSHTLLNALHGMWNGHLHIAEVKYGPTLYAPGTHDVGGLVFGRNYGVLTVALVPLAIIEGLAAVADLRIALVALWAATILALSVVVGRIVGREREATLAGSAVALAVFVVNVVVATPLDPTKTELYALQITHMVIGAFVVVLVYRLLRSVHDARVGLFGAAVVALGTPIGLWATIPKRHVVTAAVVFVVAYALYQSRTVATEGRGSSVRYRAMAYASVGLLAWVHAPEALLVLLVLALVDLPTAPRYDLRALVALVAALFVSTIPFLVTNFLISGSPIKPPRMLPQAGPGTGEPDFGGGGGGGGPGVVGLLISAIRPLTVLVDLLVEGLVTAVRTPIDLFHTFVRSGYVEDVARRTDSAAINLTLLESGPVVAATLGSIPLAVASLRDGSALPDSRILAAPRVVDLFFGTFVVLFTLLYVPRLPIHAQITVRYLFSLFPVLVYFVARLPAVRGVVADHWRTMTWSYAGGVFIGGQLLVATLTILEVARPEAFQFHALLGLALAVPLAAWALAGRSDGWYGRVGAVAIGLTTAAGTVFMVMVAIDYLTIGGSQALPVMRFLGDVVDLTG